MKRRIYLWLWHLGFFGGPLIEEALDLGNGRRRGESETRSLVENNLEASGVPFAKDHGARLVNVKRLSRSSARPAQS